MPKDWRTDLLRLLNAPATKQNLRFLDTWQRWEGGHTENDASFNWLNTTRGPGRSINSVGVKAFPDYETGIAETAATIQNGRYPDIIRGLRSGNPFAAAPVAGLSTWVSGSPTGNLGYASKVLGKKVGGQPPRKAVPTPGTPSPIPGAMAMTTLTVPRAPDLTGAILANLGADDPQLQLSNLVSALASQPKTQEVQIPAPTIPTIGPLAVPASGKPGKPGAPGVPGQALPVPKGKGIITSRGWKETPHAGGHTGGLPEFKQPADIMGDPGTPIYAPSSGVITKIGSAQEGGQSYYIMGDDGWEYWLGHIDARLPVGARIKTNQLIATVSGEHPRPHLHIDRRRVGR